MFVVYQIKNILNGFVYIGSTKNFHKRMKTHLRQLKNNNHHSFYLQDAFNEFGESNFIFEIIFESDNKIMVLDKEKEIIANTMNKYNISLFVNGGDNISYHPKLNEIKKKHSDNYKRIQQKNNGVHPFQLRNNTGENNFNWKGGKYCDDKFCLDCNIKISNNAFRCSSCNSKLKTGNKNSFYGKTHTQETKEKLRVANLGRFPINTLKVIIDGVVYDSATQAAKINGLNLPSVLNRCRNPKFPNYEFYQEKEVG